MTPLDLHLKYCAMENEKLLRQTGFLVTQCAPRLKEGERAKRPFHTFKNGRILEEYSDVTTVTAVALKINLVQLENGHPWLDLPEHALRANYFHMLSAYVDNPYMKRETEASPLVMQTGMEACKIQPVDDPSRYGSYPAITVNITEKEVAEHTYVVARILFSM